MKLHHARIAGAVAAFAFAVFTAHAEQSSPEGDTVVTSESQIQPFVSIETQPKVRHADASQVFKVTLSEPAAVNKAIQAPAPGAPLQVGFARAVPALADGRANASNMQWKTLASGAQVGAFSVSSPGALALRVGLRVKAIPSGTLVRFYAPTDGAVYEVSAEEIQENIGRNLHAGELSEDALLYWSPPVEGSTLVVEVELPAGQDASSLDVSAPSLSHLLGSPANNFAEVTKALSQSCELDVMCYPDWMNQSNSEARITFIDGASSYLCSGTLIVGANSSTAVPYFLTANHCVNSQASASTVVSYWFYRSTACNSGVRGTSQTLYHGGTLLYHTASTDSSLMSLSDTPPGGAVYSGWSVGSAPSNGASVAGVHYPRGDMQKISLGSVAGYASCTSTGSDTFNCNGASSASGGFVLSQWSQGLTEPGSSGSGLFLQNGRYIIGQLYGGSSSTCGGGDPDVYGRFDTAYRAGIGTILAGGSVGTSGGTSGGTGGSTGGGAGATYTPAADYSAMWWNPSESGWGIDVTQHNSSLFAAWYAYNDSGWSSWLVMPGGTWTSTTSISGNLYRTSGPPSTGPFDPSQVHSKIVGTATLSFQGTDRAVLSYNVDGVSGTKAIQRETFGPADTKSVANYADLWWNASESGWGLTINQQYSTLFALLYTYGPYGAPAWYSLPGGTWTSANTYTGTLYSTTMPAGNFYASAYNPANLSVTAVGTMTLQFGSSTAGTLTYSINGQVYTKAITREPF